MIHGDHPGTQSVGDGVGDPVCPPIGDGVGDPELPPIGDGVGDSVVQKKHNF